MFRTRAIMLENKDIDKMGNLNGKKGGIADISFNTFIYLATPSLGCGMWDL